jgi:hypothetical protein
VSFQGIECAFGFFLSAGPLFYTGFLGRRLRKSDARFVDVVHTDMSEYGITGSLGHVDYFVNGNFLLNLIPELEGGKDICCIYLVCHF